MSEVTFTLAEESVPVGRAMSILPALRHLHLRKVLGWSTNTEIIERFVAARKLGGLPISVHYEGYNGDISAWATEVR